MTSSSEVIALELDGAGDRPDPFRFKTNFKPKKQLKHYPYFSDPAIVPRVKQYLEDNRDKVYVDIDEMVTELQRKYRDYSKRKRNIFKGLVEKAFSVVLKTYNITDNEAPRDGDESDSSSRSEMDVDSEDIDLIVESNSGNQQVLNMYMQQNALKKLAAGKTGTVTEGGKELINLSSDDEDDQIPAKRAKQVDPTNGNDSSPPSTQKSQNHKPANGQATPEEVGIPVENPTPSSTGVVTPTVSAPTAVESERPKRKRPAVESSSGPSASAASEVSKRRRREIAVLRPSCSFKDVGGCSVVLQEVCKLLVHLRHPEIFKQIGVSPPRGFLLHGPPGCGKSLLANAIAGELGVPLLKVSAPELVAGVSGESEERIRDLFDQAASLAPCVLFLDEIDAITPNRNNAQREMERRIVAQLLTTLDELGEKEGGDQVLVVGATNRPDSLDPALRRAGRFDREVCMGIPDRESRLQILRVVCGHLALAPEVSCDAGFEELASLTPGYVGADLAALTREAAMVAVNRVFAQLQDEKEQAANEVKRNVMNISLKETTEACNQSSENLTETDSTSSKAEGVSQAESSEAAKPAENAQTSKTAQISSDEICEVVNLEDGDSQASTTPQETTQSSDNKKDGLNSDEASAQAAASVEKPESEEPIKVSENTDKGNASSGNAVQDVEIIPQKTDTEKEKTDTVNDEIAECAKKTECDLEVLEVDMVKKNEVSEASSASVNGASESSTHPVEEMKDMALSQKLNPLSMWSPALCQLMAWIKDTPPLSAAQLNNLTITMDDFHEALHHVQPSSKREGFVTVPDVTWEDVGSLSNVRAELQLCILAPVRYSKEFSQLGLQAPSGVLLCGPPGCGKTLLAKAVANEAGINFISVKGPELLNMYVGESERAVRQVFQRARNSAPCVIFFDELDALCPKRSDSGDNGVSSRVVNQLLTEMDGVEGRAAVFLMAASNRPDIIDPAVLRPGRLDKIVYVGLPNAEDRIEILRALTKNGSRPQLASDVNLADLAKMSQLEGYSGADIAALVREAGVQALREYIGSGGNTDSASLSVALRHFQLSASKIRPSVTPKDRKHYDKLKQMYSFENNDSNSLPDHKTSTDVQKSSSSSCSVEDSSLVNTEEKSSSPKSGPDSELMDTS